MHADYLLNTTADNFEALALALYQEQYDHVEIYRNYVDLLNRPKPTCLAEIPFLPISFFKSSKVLSDVYSTIDLHFQSSGTGNDGRSQHFVADKRWYETSFTLGFQHFFGPVEAFTILALLPNYVEQGSSSLVYMVDSLIKQTHQPLSGFLLDNPMELIARYEHAKKNGGKVLIFGVSYALLDLAEQGIDLSEAIVVETGGMKGRRKELTKAQLHEALKSGLGISNVYSEYGMTELLSQGYSMKDGKFEVVPWMKILVRDPYDPFHLWEDGRSGGINVIDLANQHSCAFIQTQDMGRLVEDGFYLEGRLDDSDIRGCNLMLS